MIPADALSRRHDHNHRREDNEEKIALPDGLFVRLVDLELQDAVTKGQESDKTALEALKKLEDPETQSTKWHLKEGHNSKPCLFYNGKIYVPDDLSLRSRIVSDHHNIYWWPGMATFIKNYIVGCATCQQFKIRTHPTKPFLMPIPSGSSRLFGALGMDFMTDLPLSNGFDSIMVVVDHGLSKGAVMVPTTKLGLSAEQTAQLYIDNIYSRFGLADSILTDRGPQFDSEFWKELCKQLGIKTKLTTAFHPQANGETEQVNREIQLYLSVYCINNPSSWSQSLKKAKFVYNNQTHTERTQSPFELMYGTFPKAIIEPYQKGTLETQQRIDQLRQLKEEALLAHKYA